VDFFDLPLDGQPDILSSRPPSSIDADFAKTRSTMRHIPIPTKQTIRGRQRAILARSDGTESIISDGDSSACYHMDDENECISQERCPVERSLLLKVARLDSSEEKSE
jgi:hypothetical protein